MRTVNIADDRVSHLDPHGGGFADEFGLAADRMDGGADGGNGVGAGHGSDHNCVKTQLSTSAPNRLRHSVIAFERKAQPTASMPVPSPAVDFIIERARQRIWQLMEEQKLNRSDVAKGTGLSTSGFYGFVGYDRGQKKRTRSPTLETLAALAIFFKTSICDVIGENASRERPQRSVTIPWLAMGEPEFDGRAAVGASRDELPLFFSKQWVNDHLFEDARRGRLVRIDGDPFDRYLHSGDIVCIDVEQIDYRRQPGLYCIFYAGEVSVRRLMAAPEGGVQFASEGSAYPSAIVDGRQVQTVGRVVWRSGGL